MPTAWALTARAADLERLGRQFADPAVGGVVLTGPAGVGKTRLGEEALRAAAEGRPTARAVGHDATRAIPLGALAHLLPADLMREVGVGDDDRATLFHRARLHFTERTDAHRLLLLVDDVDQLDDTSLALLLPLTIDRTVFLVATLRAGRTPPAVVSSLIKDGHLVVEEIHPLTQDEVATLLHRVLDGPIDARSVERLAAVSEGNLQVLQEVVRRAEQQGALRCEDGVWRLHGLPIPARLEELVASHLAEVDADERELLEVLAVAGTVGVADLETFAAPGVLDALDGRGYIEVVVDRRRVRATLAHPVYGEVLRQQLSPLRERRTKRRLADRLEAHGARRRQDLTQLALWRLEAGGDVDAEVLLAAGRLALVGRDPALAARFATAAAERGASHDAARIAVEAAALAADADGVERAVAAVWDDPDLPAEHRAHLCRRLAMARFASGDLPGALAAVEQAAALVDEPAALASVQAQRASLLATNGRPGDALAVLALVDDTGDPRIRVELESARSISEASIGHFDAALAAAQAGARAQHELPAWLARRGAATHVVNEAHAYAYYGHYREARAVLDAALAPAEAAGALAATVWFHLVLGEVERDSGYGRAALRHFEAATALAARAGQQAAAVWALVGVAQGHLLLGDTAAAAAALEEADAAGDSPVATSWATRRAHAGVAAGRPGRPPRRPPPAGRDGRGRPR